MTREELIAKIQDIEWDDFEAKEALNELPKNTWDTVSAFSNTSGGWVLCGVAQRGKKFEIQGVENGEKVENDFLTTLRNKDKFNHVLQCRPAKIHVDGKLVLAFYIPSSEFKPIWYGSPKNTFIRSGSGDQRATDLEIAAMYRDQAFGTQSEKTIEGRTIADLNAASFASYRRYIQTFNPEFRAGKFDDAEFCEYTGITRGGVLTYAGLLMFGKNEVVRTYANNFWVDYIEIPGNSYSDAAVRFSYRLPELDNIWDSYEAIFQRLRLHVDAAPFSPRPDGFAPDDESQLYALREGLVNMCSHADYFSPMHPTVRVFDNRISFQNPGKIVVDMAHLRDRYQSAPRNPSILKLFRYTKISDNAGYGMDKIYSWERLTGEKVEIVTDVMYSEVTFWRPKIGTSIKRKGEDLGAVTTPATTPVTTPATTPVTTPKKKRNEGKEVREKIFRIIRSSPTLSKPKIADLCGLKKEGIRYHIEILRKEVGLRWEGNSQNGRWKWDKE
jgi:ATP-dependent DNA helicase RecG